MTATGATGRGPAPAVEVLGVSKRYWKVAESATLLRSILPFARHASEELWAVRDVSLEVLRGETVGIIGQNGAGKTSLLRMIAGVTRPTQGRVRVHGRVAPLIGVGVGFHQELTGRENVVLNGQLLGLDERAVRERFEEIVAFAELEGFIDTPVKFYSSGMFMRLGFSVAAHADPDVLVVDEVLAVGDVAFQLKCFERMRALQERGTTILVVSHALTSIQMLCPRTVVLHAGGVAFSGETSEAIGVHHDLLGAAQRARAGRAGAEAVEVGPEWLEDLDGARVGTVAAGAALRHRARLHFAEEVHDPVVTFQVWLPSGLLAYARKAVLGRPTGRFGPGDEAEVAVDLRAGLAPGAYRVVTVVSTSDGRTELGRSDSGITLQVAAREGTVGVADLEARIRLDGEEVSDWSSLRLDG